MARISIIVPVYNVGQHLRKCLDSILGQTFRDWELICVDDGSTDGSADILAEYAARDGRIRTIRQANAGQSAARNRGLDEAGGEYVMFCDADDWVEPDWCEALHGAIVGQPDIDLVVARAFIDGTCDRKRRKALEANQKLRFRGVCRASADLFPRVDHAVWMKIYRRSLIERHAVRFPVGELCEDWTFSYAYLSVCGNVRFLDRALYHYVQRDGSTLNGAAASDRVQLDFIRQWNRLRRFLVSAGKWPEWRLRMLEYGVVMFGIGGERLSQRACALAEGFLRSMPPEDFSGLPEGLSKRLAMVRTRTVHGLWNRRWKLGPVTVVKRKLDLSGESVSVLGIRLYARRH